MTLDERFAYLAEKQQALAETVELFIHEGRGREARIDSRIERVVGIAENLVRVVENHEGRISDLEE